MTGEVHVTISGAQRGGMHPCAHLARSLPSSFPHGLAASHARERKRRIRQSGRKRRREGKKRRSILSLSLGLVLPESGGVIIIQSEIKSADFMRRLPTRIKDYIVAQKVRARLRTEREGDRERGCICILHALLPRSRVFTRDGSLRHRPDHKGFSHGRKTRAP